MFINIKKIVCFLLLLAFSANIVQAGISVVRSNGISITQTNGIDFVGVNGMRFTGADGFLGIETNGMRFTGADGGRFTGADGARFTGADGSTFTGTNGARFTGADGARFTGADGMRFTGADGYRFTGADGTIYRADSIIVTQPAGVLITKMNGARFTGVDGLGFTGTNLTLTTADGARFTGADGARFTGADTVVGINSDGIAFSLNFPADFSITGPDGARFTGADVTVTGLNGARFTGVDGFRFTGADDGSEEGQSGLQSIDPELAFQLNQAADDSNINAVIIFHQYPTESDLNDLRNIGIIGGTQFRALPMISVTTTRANLIAVSRLSRVRSIYGNRTLNLNSDPYLKTTQIQRVSTDKDLQKTNAGMPVSGRNITVAVLDTGVNSTHNDLAGRVVQNVRLLDTQSAAVGFVNPTPIENLTNTDLSNGHGTFVAGVVAGSGVNSGGKYSGVAPGAKILGLSAGDLSLVHVLSGFDYLLLNKANYNVRVVNCSFSADTVFDFNDPVNIATKLLTENGINVVFSAGNTGAGNGTLNPYAVAPWVISVGATDANRTLANFSSRGIFGDSLFTPSLVAPGVDLVSLRSAATQMSALGVAGTDLQRLTPAELPFYTTASGTSFSAPQVAGAIALMLEANPNLSTAAVKDILQRSATPLPSYYSHEVGAGMLNTYAAVLEAAFPNRKTGLFRAVLERDAVNFINSTTQTFSGVVNPDSTVTNQIQVSPNALQTGIHIAWGDMNSTNDLALKVFDADGNLAGNSNNVNLPGLNGRREQVFIDNAKGNVLQANVSNSFGMGSSQNFFGVVETTRVEYGKLKDLQSLSPQNQAVAHQSLSRFLLLPEGNNFRCNAFVSRADLAAAFIRAGLVPQYIAAKPLYSDVRDLTTRSVVESVQSNLNGKLILDSADGKFYPHDAVSKLASAVAFVKAANLESAAAASTLPLTVADAYSIPSQWRGYVALALQKGWLKLDNNNNFKPNRAITRIELAQAIISLK